MIMYDISGKGCLRGDEAQLAFEIATVIVMYASRVLGYDVVNSPETAIDNGYKYIDKAISMILSDTNSLEKALVSAYEIRQVDKFAEILHKISES